ncbi:GNAT family N-acetyltransferase [Armatimonas sp.]|uniref:GNAT family N-acetyltransferase n=1 Tax=Armatimonas sp. TaxID=1872638 RepID=UPI003753C7D2
MGIVRLGEVPSGVSFLMRSLLETNPECQSINARGTKYRGIGRVLIARLVAESYNLGTQGQIRVKAHPRARGFYEALGFIPSKKLAIDGGLSLAYDLFAEVAGKIFDKATESSEREL